MIFENSLLKVFLKSFIFQNIRKAFFWEIVRNFLILGLESSISRSIRKTFLRKNKKFFQDRHFFIYELGMKSVSGSPYVYYSQVPWVPFNCASTLGILLKWPKSTLGVPFECPLPVQFPFERSLSKKSLQYYKKWTRY